MKKVLLAVGLFFIMYSGLYAQPEAYNHPELDWNVIETEHFSVYYHNGLDRTPKILAKIAEEIYGPITSLYKYEPDGKIHIIVKDTDDYSNGAAYYYDNKIEIWATPMNFILRGTHNWLRCVLSHELAHIISLGTMRKMPRRFPALYFQGIGYEEEKRNDVLYGFPNVIMSYPFAGTVVPMWFAEGMAQHGSDIFGYDEWDSHRDMIIRMRVLNNDLLTLNQMGVFGKTSIGNESTYNQGYGLVKYIEEIHGREALEKLSRSMSSFTALSFNRAVKKVFGISQDELYGQWKEHIETYYRKKSQTISEHRVRGDIIEIEGSANLFPQWAPDGKMYAYLSNAGSDYISFTSLCINDIVKKERRLIKAGVSSSVSWSRDGKKLFYSKMGKCKNGSYFNDLYMYDFYKNKEKRLTFGKRASYPACSPDGSKVLCSVGSDGNYNLAVFDVASKKITYLTDFSNGTDIYKSSWSPDGSKIVFCLSGDYSREIAVIDSDGRNFKYIFNGKEDARNPVFSPDGKKIYYSCDKTGIFNIYSFDFETKTVEQITNVLGGAFMPSVNESGEIIYTLYTNEGHKIAYLKDTKPVKPEYARYIENYSESKPEITYDDSQVPHYSSSAYKTIFSMSQIVPRFMFDYGKPKVGLAVMTNDLLGKSSLYMTGMVNPDFDHDLYGSLEFKGLKPTFFLDLYSISRHLEEGSDEFKLSLLEADLGTYYKINEEQELRATFIYARYSSKMRIEDPVFFTFRAKYCIIKELSFSWNLNQRIPVVDGVINPSNGRDISLRYTMHFNEFLNGFNYEKNFGFENFDPYRYNSINLDWSEYKRLPVGIDRNALTYNLKFGLIDRPVDSFFHLFGGGMIRLKGYSFYSLEGDKMLINSLTYRAPLVKNIDFQLGHFYFDKLYGSIAYYYGNNWQGNSLDFSDFKKSIDFQLRLDMFSYYNYPTRVAFDAAYGFDRFQSIGGYHGKEWKFYLQVLFEYL